MSRPTKIFQQNKQPRHQGSLVLLQQQVKYWQNLTKLIQPLLPQPEQWQVVCYQAGILTISGYNQVMVSQLNYLGTQYTHQLAQLEPLQHLQKIQAILNTTPQVQPKKVETHHAPSPLDADTQQMIKDVAPYIEHTALRQALLKLARQCESTE